MLIITEILKKSNYTDKYDNYHYILTFELDQFDKIKTFKEALELSYNKQAKTVDEFFKRKFPTFKNVFVTDNLLIKKEKETIKFINLYKCYFKDNKFIQPFIVNILNRSFGNTVKPIFSSPKNRGIKLHKVDLILINDDYKGKNDIFSVLSENLLQNIINHNIKIRGNFIFITRESEKEKKIDDCSNANPNYNSMIEKLENLISDNKNIDDKFFEYNLSIVDDLDSAL